MTIASLGSQRHVRIHTRCPDRRDGARQERRREQHEPRRPRRPQDPSARPRRAVGPTHRLAQSASPPPTATPINAKRIPSPSTRRTTSRPPAPNAIRTPISCVRCATAYAMTLYSPTAASTSASPPNTHEHRRAELPRALSRIDDLAHRRHRHVARARHDASAAAVARRSACGLASPRVRTNSTASSGLSCSIGR